MDVETAFGFDVDQGFFTAEEYSPVDLDISDDIGFTKHVNKAIEVQAAAASPKVEVLNNQDAGPTHISLYGECIFHIGYMQAVGRPVDLTAT